MNKKSTVLYLLWVGFFCAAAVTVAFASSESDTEQPFTVIESTVPNIQIGDMLNKTSDVVIPLEKYISYIDSRTGETVRLDGPYAGTLSDYVENYRGGVESAFDRLRGSSAIKGKCGTKEGAVRGDC